MGHPDGDAAHGHGLEDRAREPALGPVVLRDDEPALDDQRVAGEGHQALPSRPFLVADLPFLSYATLERALDASQRVMQEGGAKMVKLEGGREQASIVEYLSVRGVPVCAHLGLQPQFIHKMGAFKVQGRDDAAAEAMVHDARVLAEAGADLLLLECIPAALGKRIAEASPVPVIGIGAGHDVDGQILVLHDILHISPTVTLGRTPRFVKNYMQGAPDIESAIRAYVQEVKSGAYPAPEHCFAS